MKREREPACPVCGHYHKWEIGEECNICGHRPTPLEQAHGALALSMQPSACPPCSTPAPAAFPSEILPGFLYLGSYDNASRNEILKVVGVKYILNTVPTCQNLYRNSFVYFNVTEGGNKRVPLDQCLKFLDDVSKESSRVLVHCMSGKSRSSCVVIAYLMRSKQWTFAQALHWVQERHRILALNADATAQLTEYEQEIFGQNFAVPSLAGGGGQAPLPFGQLHFSQANPAIATHCTVPFAGNSPFNFNQASLQAQQFVFGTAPPPAPPGSTGETMDME